MAIHEEIKLICKILLSGDFSLVEKLKFDKVFFRLPECREAFEYIRGYTKNVNTYGFVPSIDIFKKKHPGFLILDEVKESIPVLCNEIRLTFMKAQINEIVENMEGLKADPYAALEFLHSGTAEMLSQHTTNTKLIRIEESGDLLKEDFNRLESGGMTGIPWPYPGLNEQTGGIKKGDLIVKYARPKSGKTSLTIGEATKIYENTKIRIGVINPEDDEWDLLRLFQCYRARVDYFSLKNKTLSDIEKKRYLDACDSIAKEGEIGKLFFVENCPGATINHIRSRIDEFNLDLVIVNGVYHLKDAGAKKVDADWKVLTNISRGLKQLAKEKQVAIIGITQANRQTEQVAYADAFTQDCDAMIKMEVIKRVNETKEAWTKHNLEYVRGGGIPIEFCVYTKLGVSIQECAFPQDEMQVEEPVKKQSQSNPFSFNSQQKKKLFG